MNEPALEYGQMVIVKPNTYSGYTHLWYKVLSLGNIASTDNGAIAQNCTYGDENNKLHYVSIPLVLLWRVADDESLVEIYEHSIIQPDA